MSEETKTPTEYQLIGPSEDGKLSDLLAGQSAKESRQRLQALISEWLRMENLVVLTGAGSSRSSGGKLMGDLETNVLQTVRAIQGIAPDVLDVIDKRRAGDLIVDDPLGFEEWLSYLVNAAHLTSAKSSPFKDVEWRDSKSPNENGLNWLVERPRRSTDHAATICTSCRATAFRRPS